jgi:hypothetical protein
MSHKCNSEIGYLVRNFANRLRICPPVCQYPHVITGIIFFIHCEIRIITTVIMMIIVLRDVTPCNLLDIHLHFTRTCYLHLQDRKHSFHHEHNGVNDFDMS